MNIKVGNDIVEVRRIKYLIEKYGDKFLNKVYTKNEIEYCNKSSDSKYQSLAARFAAKEAVFKSISDLYNNKLEWKKIEILNEKSGRPKVNLFELSDKVSQIDISLSHEKDYAIASVIIILE